jgi:outer membrane protein OmpA-like peptidoglycan-associated protein
MYTGGLEFDRNHNYVGIAYGFDKFALGLSWINASTSDLVASDVLGSAGNTFTFAENAILLSGGFMSGPVALGATGKLVNQDLGVDVVGSDGSVTGLGIDFGVQFNLGEYVRLGATVQDLFTHLGDNDDEDKNQVPTNLRLGAAVYPYDGLLVGLDVEKEQHEESITVHAGAEYWHPFSEDFRGALRLGVDDGDFAGGLGLGISFLELNYAYVVEPQDFLGENHRFSLNLDFGEKREHFRPLVDGDGDGVADADDECPDEPEDFDGFQDNDGCPDYDNDGDGILDSEDQCPNQAEDFDGFEDEDGCPDLDNDGDGIVDANDRCPNEAENFNGFEDSDGCPDDAPIYFPLAHINFKFGTAEISGADPIPVLEEVVRIMKDNPNINVEIQGHTDNIGTDDANMQLSLRRSEAVKKYVADRGIAASRLTTRGFGEARPIDSNDTDLGRARNRRIEFVVVK